MAEAVAAIGLIASVTQIIETGGKVLKRLDDLASAAGEAPEFVKSIRARLLLLRQTLGPIHAQAANRQVDDNTAQALLDVTDSTLRKVEELEVLLGRAFPTGVSSSFERKVQALKSLRHDRKVQIIINQLQCDIQLLTFNQINTLSDRVSQKQPGRDLGNGQSEHQINVTTQGILHESLSVSFL